LQQQQIQLKLFDLFQFVAIFGLSLYVRPRPIQAPLLPVSGCFSSGPGLTAWSWTVSGSADPDLVSADPELVSACWHCARALRQQCVLCASRLSLCCVLLCRGPALLRSFCRGLALLRSSLSRSGAVAFFSVAVWRCCVLLCRGPALLCSSLSRPAPSRRRVGSLHTSRRCRWH